MNDKILPMRDMLRSPANVLSFNGVAYLYAYTMIPIGIIPPFPYHFHFLHTYFPENTPLDLTVDFPFIIVGTNNTKIYHFPSWFDFQRSPVPALTADWVEYFMQ
jgi:hypothetical protein